MKMIPIFRCRSMASAIQFYTTILKFRLAEPTASENDWVVALVWDDIELLLTSLEGDQKPGFAVNVRVDDIDVLYRELVENGLDVSGREESPVHQRPTDQSWGTREFYVTDADGNTLRFTMPLE